MGFALHRIQGGGWSNFKTFFRRERRNTRTVVHTVGNIAASGNSVLNASHAPKGAMGAHRGKYTCLVREQNGSSQIDSAGGLAGPTGRESDRPRESDLSFPRQGASEKAKVRAYVPIGLAARNWMKAFGRVRFGVEHGRKLILEKEVLLSPINVRVVEFQREVAVMDSRPFREQKAK